MKTKIKKAGLLLLVSVILLSGGIFTEVEKAKAYKCMVVNPAGGPCDVVQVAQLGCRWKDAPGDNCTSGQYACAGGDSITNIAVCLVNDLHPRKCDTASACFTDGSPVIPPPPIITLGAYQYCLEDKCPAAAGAPDGAVCRVTLDDNSSLAAGVYPPFDPGESVTGVWDSSDSKCVQCNDANGVIETTNCGDTTGTHFVGVCTGTADNRFESACGADASCDEKSVGDACNPPAGGSCDANGKCVAAVVTHTECSGLICTVVAGVGADQCSIASPCTCTCADESPDCCGGSACLPIGDNDCSCNALGGILCSLGIPCTGAVIPNHSDAGTCCDSACAEKWACSASNALQCCAGCTDIINCATLNGVECAPGKEWTNCDIACAVDSVCGNFDDANSMPKACGCSCSSVAPVCGVADTICPLGCTNPPDPDCPAAGPGACAASPGCLAVAPITAGTYSTPAGTCPAGQTCYQCNAGLSWDGSDCTAAGPGCDPLGAACTAGSCCAGLTCDVGVTDTCIVAAGPGPGPAACDPDAWFFCNPLRGSVETLAEGGEQIVGYILGLIGSIALLLIIISGAMYMTSAGNEERIATSKRVLTGAVIGLGIALLAYSLLAVIMKVLGV